MTIDELFHNERFFYPLTGKYRQVYFDSVCILIDEMKRVPTLYENDARKLLDAHLRETAVVSERQEDQASSEEDPDDGNIVMTGAGILQYLRTCGWIAPREIGRNGEYITSVTVVCRRFTDFVRKLMDRSSSGEMSNKIFTMYEIMRSVDHEESFRLDRPYANILTPLMDAETELKNELGNLQENIHIIMKAVIRKQTANSLGQFLIRDEILQRFFQEYFFLKREGTIPSLIAYVLDQTRLMRHSELYQKMIDECMATRALSQNDAELLIERDFLELERFLDREYNEMMSLIDQRITNYYYLANSRISMMASGGRETEEELTELLNCMRSMGEEEREHLCSELADRITVKPQKYIGRRSFVPQTRRKRTEKTAALAENEITLEEKQRKTEELLRSARDPYSVHAVSGYLNHRLPAAQGEKLELSKEENISRADAMMYTAAMIYATDRDFPFQVEWERGLVETEELEMTDILIQRKEEDRK